MKIPLILFMLITVSCQSESKKQGLTNCIVIKEKIQLKQINENTFNIILPTKQIVEMKNDTNSETSLLNINGHEQLPLKYYLTLGYIGDVFWIESQNEGNYILIESYEYGVSGIAASLVNATMIKINDDKSKPIYFNSFHWDVDRNLKIVNDKLEIEIVSLHNREKELYCATSFYLTNGKLKSKEQSLCYSLTEKGLMPLNNCDNCIPPQTPFVMEKAQ